MKSSQVAEISRHLVESSSDCVKILGPGGEVVYVNPAAIELMELCGSEEMLNRSWVDFWEGQYREVASAAVERATAGERTAFEGVCKTAAGTSKWWDVVVTPVSNDIGTVVQLLVVSRDITARRQKEAFLTGQHQVLEMIATGAPLQNVLSSLVHLVERQTNGMLCSVVMLDEDGVHVRHGAAPSLPRAYADAIDGAAIGPRAGSCGTAMYWGRPVIATDILADPIWEDYRELAVTHGLRACWSAPILSARKTVLGSFAMYYAAPRGPTREELRLIDSASDIAGIAIEHQRAQEALRRSEERNRAILQAIPDWVFIVSASGVFLDFHGKDRDNLVVPPEVFLGKTVRETLPPALADVLQAAFGRALLSGEPEKIEYTLGSDQAERFYEARVVRCDRDKVLSIVRDITDRKRAELDAATQRRELLHLSRVTMLGELTGALAHELSQPLAAILSNAQAAVRFLSREPVDLSELRATLDDIVGNDRRAGAVIDRLRALLKKTENVLEPLSLNDVTREVLDLIRSDLLARRVSLNSDLDSTLPSVLGDRVQLQQVVLNLVLNACEAMSETEHVKRRLTVTTGVDNRFVHLSIIDRGTGIPEHQVNAIFEPFVTFRTEGLGLGLAICRSIVLAHGGRIRAENNADGGATFRCSLPIMSS
jgi:PAS domain S-box-containing protein